MITESRVRWLSATILATVKLCNSPSEWMIAVSQRPSDLPGLAVWERALAQVELATRSVETAAALRALSAEHPQLLRVPPVHIAIATAARGNVHGVGV